LKEPASIVVFECSYPAINSALFPDTESAIFWSSTTGAQIGIALILNFKTSENYFSYLDIEGYEHYVSLVRGGG